MAITTSNSTRVNAALFAVHKRFLRTKGKMEIIRSVSGRDHRLAVSNCALKFVGAKTSVEADHARVSRRSQLSIHDCDSIAP